MSVLIALHPGPERADLLDRLVALGLAVEPLRGLPDHYLLPGVDPAQFPFPDHPALAAIDDADGPAGGSSTQAISFDALMSGGSWAIARSIRRVAPWLAAGRIVSPVATYFRCARTGAGVDVYVLDTGLRYDHAEFGGRGVFAGGVYGSGGVDDQGHGTSVAACAVGGSVGIARGAGLRIVKGLDSNNAGTLSNIAAAIGIARDDYLARAGTNRPAVLNLSLFANGATVETAVAACIDAGMVVVASAGNDLSGTVPIPGSTADVICVGGVAVNDTPYYTGNFGTNFGTRVDILAGAQHVWTASFSGASDYQLGFGTSFAVPLVAGAVACMLQDRPRLTTRAQVQAVRSKLFANATTGRFAPQAQYPVGTLPDRILYLDPDALTEVIPGL